MKHSSVRFDRRETRGWPVWLSLGLHLTILLALLIMPPTPPPAATSEPPTVDVVMGEGPPEAKPEPSAPPQAPATPDVPAPPAIPQAEIPPSPPPTPAPPPVPQAELPLPTPPPPPIQQAEIPPPTPPLPVPPTPPPQMPPLHRAAAARAPVHPAGTPAHAESAQTAASGASNGDAWMGKLKQWWEQHSFYPKEASQTNEGGNVRVHIVIAPDGQIMAVNVVQGSGLSVLDEAAVAVFRNAHLPSFPPTPTQGADVVVTLHYRPADSNR